MSRLGMNISSRQPVDLARIAKRQQQSITVNKSSEVRNHSFDIYLKRSTENPREEIRIDPPEVSKSRKLLSSKENRSMSYLGMGVKAAASPPPKSIESSPSVTYTSPSVKYDTSPCVKYDTSPCTKYDPKPPMVPPL